MYKAMTQTGRIYSEYKVLRLLLKEQSQLKLFLQVLKEFQSLVELAKKELKYDIVLARGCTRHLVR